MNAVEKKLIEVRNSVVNAVIDSEIAFIQYIDVIREGYNPMAWNKPRAQWAMIAGLRNARIARFDYGHELNRRYWNILFSLSKMLRDDRKAADAAKEAAEKQ